MSQRASGYERKPDEAYYTPPWVGGVIARWLKARGVSSIWEPAPGSGQLARVLTVCEFSVIETGGDFLRLPQTRHFDAIVTNPPYGAQGKDAEAFIRHAVFGLEARIVAFLLRVDFDSAKTRRPLFGYCPTFWGKIVLLDRIRWFPGLSGPSENHAWFIWDRAGRNDGGLPCIEYDQM